MGRSSSLGGCFSLTLAFVGAIARLRQWPGGFAVGSRPVGRMGLQCCRPRAWGEMRVLCLPRAFSYVRSRDSHGRRLGFSRLAARVGDCSIVSARLVT